MFEVRQLPNGDLEGQSAAFMSMSRETHENAESYINNAMFSINYNFIREYQQRSDARVNT